jgi:hypothetical protein
LILSGRCFSVVGVCWVVDHVVVSLDTVGAPGDGSAFEFVLHLDLACFVGVAGAVKVVAGFVLTGD